MPGAMPSMKPGMAISQMDRPQISWLIHNPAMIARFSRAPPMVMKVTDARLPIRPDIKFPHRKPPDKKINHRPNSPLEMPSVSRARNDQAVANEKNAPERHPGTSA